MSLTKFFINIAGLWDIVKIHSVLFHPHNISIKGFVFVLPTVESSVAVAAFWTAYPAQTKAKPVEL